MSKKDYKKGMADAMSAYQEFGKKQEAAIQHVEGEVARTADKVEHLGDQIGNVVDYISDQEKAALYRLNTPVDIADLENAEKRMLLAILYQLSAMEEPTEMQQTYLRAIQQYLKIYNPQTEIDLESVENIEDISAQKAVLQTVLEFFYLGSHPKTYTEEQLDFLDCFQVNRKTREEISGHIDAIVSAVGTNGLAEKYGFVPEENSVCSYQDNGSIPEFVADLCSSYERTGKGNPFAETEHYICFYRNCGDNQGFYCIQKKSGKEVYIRSTQEASGIDSISLCSKGDKVYYVFMGSAMKHRPINIMVLDIENGAANQMNFHPISHRYHEHLSITENFFVCSTSNGAYWWNLNAEEQRYKIETDCKVYQAVGCEGRILLLGNQDGALKLFWYDPIKNTTIQALKNPLSAMGTNDVLEDEYDSEEGTSLRVKWTFRVKDNLFILFENGDTYSLCSWDFTDSESDLVVLDQNEEPPVLYGNYLIKGDDNRTDDNSYRSLLIFDFETMEWNEIPHSACDSFSVWGDYLYRWTAKKEALKTRLDSDYRWILMN